MKKAILLVSFLVLLLFSSSAFATSILVSDSGGTLNYGYGYSNWDDMTGYLNSASGGMVTVAPNFENLAQMLSFDALWLDQRWTTGSLSANEVNNITSYIGTGRRVVLMGENSGWTSWNQQLMGIVGGSYAGGQYAGDTSSTVANALTAGVSTVYLPTAGIVASGGTALFDQNWATLWGNNVLTLLDINVFDDGDILFEDNRQFAINVANWIADSNGGNAVPIPGAVWLLGSGILGLIGARNRKKFFRK